MCQKVSKFKGAEYFRKALYTYDNNILKIDSRLSLTSLFDLEYNFLKFSSEFTWTGASFWTWELSVLAKVANWTLVMDIMEQHNDLFRNEDSLHCILMKGHQR